MITICRDCKFYRRSFLYDSPDKCAAMSTKHIDYVTGKETVSYLYCYKVNLGDCRSFVSKKNKK